MSESVAIVKVVKKRRVSITIDSITHLFLHARRSFHFQSWIQSDPPTTAPCVIEYYVDGEAIRTEYESINTWKSILTQLTEVFG